MGPSLTLGAVEPSVPPAVRGDERREAPRSARTEAVDARAVPSEEPEPRRKQKKTRHRSRRDHDSDRDHDRNSDRHLTG